MAIDREHGYVMAHLARLRGPEHDRRYRAVMSLPQQLSLSELFALLPQSACSAEQFNTWILDIRRVQERDQ